MSQDIRLIAVAAICAFIAGFFGLWNALLEMEVLDLVNAKLPPEKQYPLLCSAIACAHWTRQFARDVDTTEQNFGLVCVSRECQHTYVLEKRPWVLAALPLHAVSLST